MKLENHCLYKKKPAEVSMEETLVRLQQWKTGISLVQRSAWAIFIKALAGGAGSKHPAPCCSGVFARLDSWDSAWSCRKDKDAWEFHRLERLNICAKLVFASDLLRVLADVFECSWDRDDEWLHLEQERLQRLYLAQHEKRDAREQSYLQLVRNDINGEVEAAASCWRLSR